MVSRRITSLAYMLALARKKGELIEHSSDWIEARMISKDKQSTTCIGFGKDGKIALAGNPIFFREKARA